MLNTRISIIIPTLNEVSVIEKLLKDLNNQTFKDFEIIIADADSTDGTREVAKNYDCLIIDGGIPSVGRNKGAHVAKGDILLFLDADIRLTNKFIEESLKEFYNKNLDIAGAYFKIEPGSIAFILNNIGNNFSKFVRQFTKSPIIAGDFILIKKDVFNRIGRFEESMLIGEDNNLVLKAVKNNYKYRVLNNFYSTSSRRINKIGLFNLTLAFFIFTFAMIFKKEKSFYIQNLLKKTYGEIGKVK